MSFLAFLGIAGYVLIFGINTVLVLAAFQTSTKMGILTLLAPVYAASFGNYRLRTERRRLLAVAWWGALIAWCVLIAASDR